jgi:hypothetical protein
LAHELPVVGEDHQDANGGVHRLRAFDKLSIQDPQDATAAYNPRSFMEGACRCPHPVGQCLPWLLFNREDDEDVAYMYAFARGTVVFWL